MAIAFERIARFKAWVKNGIIGFFRGIKNRLLRLIRGGGGRGDDIQLEVTEENEFQVGNFLKMGHSRPFFLVQLVDKMLPVSGYEPQISCVGSDGSTN